MTQNPTKVFKVSAVAEIVNGKRVSKGVGTATNTLDSRADTQFGKVPLSVSDGQRSLRSGEEISPIPTQLIKDLPPTYGEGDQPFLPSLPLDPD